MKKKKIMKNILFNALVILTMIFIFLLLFPKKSYIESKLSKKEFVKYDETFINNLTNMKIASINFFEKNEKNKVTLKELIEKDLLPELKSTNGEICNIESYSEKQEEIITTNLICGDTQKQEQINLKATKENKKDKSICIYEYQKEIEPTYTEWGEWSDWQKEQIEKDDLTNVETKQERIMTEPKKEIKEQTISIPAIENTKIICPNGYIKENSQCKHKTELNTISASVSYNCPAEYKKIGTECYLNNESIAATKNYYCPSGDKYIEFELSGSECIAYKNVYTEKFREEKYFTCENGYELSGNTCYKIIEYEEEVENYEEITYYRFQKRKKTDKKIDTKWSVINDKELLNQEYNMVREITCEF